MFLFADKNAAFWEDLSFKVRIYCQTRPCVYATLLPLSPSVHLKLESKAGSYFCTWPCYWRIVSMVKEVHSLAWRPSRSLHTTCRSCRKVDRRSSYDSWGALCTQLQYSWDRLQHAGKSQVEEIQMQTNVVKQLTYTSLKKCRYFFKLISNPKYLVEVMATQISIYCLK